MALISRAQFLRGDWRGDKTEIRPPWALPEPAFSGACDGCGDCVSACSGKIVFMSRGKLPLLDFSHAGCTFCGDCRSACGTGALDRGHVPGRPPWQLRAGISVTCLAINGTSCVRCIEACEHDAIRSRPVLGGRLNLWVDQAACTGCGTCVAGCPVDAISMEYPSEQKSPGGDPEWRKQ